MTNNDLYKFVSDANREMAEHNHAASAMATEQNELGLLSITEAIIEQTEHNSPDTIIPTDIPTISRYFENRNRSPNHISKLLTIPEGDIKRNLSQDELADIYHELGKTDCIRITSDKMKASHFKHWKVSDGEGLIAIDGTAFGFVYGIPTDKPFIFKARLGFSKELDSKICIAKIGDAFYVPDCIFFRGHMISPKEDTRRTVSIVYSGADNSFDFNFAVESPNSRALDYIFRMVLVGLMGGLASGLEVMLNDTPRRETKKLP